MAQMLLSLSGLSSLTTLKLKNCNLCDGDIPRDISGLTCLEQLNLSDIHRDISSLSSLSYLDLSGNNFITIPSALTQLSMFKTLILLDRRMFKLFSELPTSTKKVWIDGCSSLEVIAIRYPRDWFDSGIFDIVMPGSEIPE
ncbi:hypothetical protein GOBAR_AA35550 [Gossypium barbadense]|uniref:Leucine-rich repeat-containing N-terminal plant-type domain-containing protein n=1 Tax=Gossypium barbadense TaxID=3634 RepID=A0A2P5REZ8_GOSBA|nr:hypothetical protein GOBAR_DD17702 [Gossypium barbadense]PPR85137.1 hypothetical protein GOBAR_AA35550 [Gossypium barbadense]